jgi:Domain of unknown function (DUF1707)
MCHSRRRHRRSDRAHGTRSWPDETRASDADRDAVVQALRDHAAAGRLNEEELDERLEVALAASTLGELRTPLADLPGTSPRLGPTPPRRERSHMRRWAYANAWWAVPLGIWGALSLAH